MGYLGIKHYFVGKAARQLISSPKGPKVRFGITRYLPEKQVAREQSALIQYLSQRIERPVELMIFEDYEDLAEQLGSGAVDIAALSPYAYVQAKRKVSGIELLATHVTAGRASYEGYIVTKADSNIDVIQDLKNKVFSLLLLCQPCSAGATSTLVDALPGVRSRLLA
jgi:phosphonate transport system substrate-binding protein